jgi:hypothetical protein
MAPSVVDILPNVKLRLRCNIRERSWRGGLLTELRHARLISAKDFMIKALGCVLESVGFTFTCDAKDNMTSGNGLSVTYTPFNKPATITRGTASVSFDHDPEHQRYAQTSLSGVTSTRCRRS